MKTACCRKRGVGGILSVLLPGVAWLAMPKCPVCLAAYIAIFTGLGVSTGFASGLKTLVIFVTFSALFLFSIRIIRKYKATKS